jgi:EAL and modified HD-GYP domain-containing signal transduction protein
MSAFLVGMFSQIDAFTDQSMGDALQGLPLDGPVRAALLGERNYLRDLLDLVRTYERGAWTEMQQFAQAAGIAVGEVPAQYVEALRWATRGNPADGVD